MVLHKISRVNITKLRHILARMIGVIFPPNPMTGYYIDIVHLRPRLTPTSEGERLTFTAKLTIRTQDDSSMFNMASTCVYGYTEDDAKVKEQYKIK